MKRLGILCSIAILLFSCSADSNGGTTSDSSQQLDGQGGSLATFALAGNYLYVVDQSDLNVFDIRNASEPVLVNKVVSIGFNIETLFAYKDFLYIGSRNGMFIYSILNPEFPEKLSQVEHFTACDPVVANDTYSFVTLHSNTFCGNDINVLEIYDITNAQEPMLVSRRNLIFPRGLGLYGDYLVVCDDEIKIFDISDAANSKLVQTIDRFAFDVIISGDLLIAIGENGLFQYQLSSSEGTVNYDALSEIAI